MGGGCFARRVATAITKASTGNRTGELAVAGWRRTAAARNEVVNRGGRVPRQKTFDVRSVRWASDCFGSSLPRPHSHRASSSDSSGRGSLRDRNDIGQRGDRALRSRSTPPNAAARRPTWRKQSAIRSPEDPAKAPQRRRPFRKVVEELTPRRCSELGCCSRNRRRGPCCG